MYPGQGSDGMQPIMSSTPQPIVSGGEAVILAPSEKKPKRWPIVVIAILVLIAIGTGIAAFLLTRSNEVVGDEVDAYIEYFVYGTEGGENQITNDTFNMNSEDYALAQKMRSYSSEESSEYFEKLAEKYDFLQRVGKEKYSADLLIYNGLYLDFYKAISQTMNSDFLIKAYNDGVLIGDLYNDLSVEGNKLLEESYNALNKYAKNRYDFYAKVRGWNCMSNGKVDYNCIWENNEEDNISWGDVTVSEELIQYNVDIYSILISNLNKFYEQGVVNG